jgi:phage terminase large subunit
VPKTATAAPPLSFFDGLWKPEVRQLEFMRASEHYRYLLYGGSRGSMKSHTLRWASLYRLLHWAEEGHRGVRVGIFCETYDTLEDRQISKIEREFPRWLGTLKRTQIDGLGFYINERYGGGVILLRNLDEPNKYVGGEFAGIAVDELTRNDKATFDALRGSMRWPGIDNTYFWGATNPLGIGLAWVRSLWIERDFPPEMQALAEQFHFVRAFPSDNPHLTKDYWADLMSQPEHIRRAWVDGDWYIPVGVMFEELRQGLHQSPPELLDDDYERCIVIDWGYEHDAAAGWFAYWQDGQAPRARQYREMVQNKTTPPVFAAQLVAKSEGERIRRAILDSAAWSTPQDGGPSPADQMEPILRQAGIHLERTPKGAGSRVRGWTLLHTWLYPGRTGGPLLTFSTECKKTWLQLTTLVRGEAPQDIEDLAKGQADDCADMVRYFVSSRPEPAPPTREELMAAALGPDIARDPRMLDLERARLERAKHRKQATVKAARRPRAPRTPWEGFRR